MLQFCGSFVGSGFLSSAQEPAEGKKVTPKAKPAPTPPSEPKATAAPQNEGALPAEQAEMPAAAPAPEVAAGMKATKNFAARSRPATAPFTWRFDGFKQAYYELLGCRSLLVVV